MIEIILADNTRIKGVLFIQVGLSTVKAIFEDKKGKRTAKVISIKDIEEIGEEYS